MEGAGSMVSLHWSPLEGPPRRLESMAYVENTEEKGCFLAIYLHLVVRFQSAGLEPPYSHYSRPRHHLERCVHRR